MIVVLLHLYFNNKTSSPHISSINAALFDSSSLRIEFKLKCLSTGLRIHLFPGDDWK